MTLISKRLSIIVNKAPVVATHIGGFDQENAARTFERYEKEASTYICPSEMEGYQRKLLETILEKRTAIGCLVAPFGYGKTTTAIGIWKSCARHGILAIPPFSCSSIAEMGQAIASGVIYRLADNPAAISQVQDAYRNYLVSSAHRLAEQDAEHFDINFETALKSIEDKIERGYLQLEASGTHMLSFVEQLTQIVQGAGFNGLLVIVDEFQQFLGNINKSVITNFRTLVWGLRTRGAVPFGLLITMDPDTERNLADRAGDILHRIKEDGLYLDFSSVYDREFPRQLWLRYAEIYEFSARDQHIVDRATLDAIGQLCERPDLSNGPRTVIDLFQRIATVYNKQKRPYTPIDLIDDFMAGEIRFDGDQSKVASLVNELTGYDVIKRVPEKYRALKLIAAFPRGCPREVAVFYDVQDAYNQIADELRGEVVVELPEGIALIDLQRVGKPQNKLNIILKKYWLQITEEEIIADRAAKLFAEYAVAPLFPQFANVLTGWKSYEASFTLMPSGSYYQVFEGTFFDEYPMRRVCVQVCQSEEEASVIDAYFDAQLIFVVNGNREELPSPRYLMSERQLILHVLVNEPFSRSLPRDVRWIEDYLKPVIMTPGVMLSLLSYIDQQVPLIDGMTENERLRIIDHRRKLQDFLLTMVFGEELFNLPEFAVISRGAQALRDILFGLFRAAYPEYQTLLTSPQWDIQMRDYVNALEGVSPIIGRGLEPLKEKKAEIAKRFRMGSYAGFESRAKQYGSMFSILNWEKDEGEVQFKRHPGEEIILRTIALHQGISKEAAYREARQYGYVVEETDYLLRFLILRGYIQYVATDDCFIPAKTLSKAELQHMAYEIGTEIELLTQTGQHQWLSNLRAQLKMAANQITIDDTDLMETQVRLLEVERGVRTGRPLAVEGIYQLFTQIRGQLYDRISKLGKKLQESKTELPLDTHLDGGMRILTAERERVSKRLNELVKTIQSYLDKAINTDDIDAVRWLIQMSSEISSEVGKALESADDLLQRGEWHTELVSLVGKIGRQHPLLEIAAQFVKTEALKVELQSIQNEIQERLSTTGLPDYQSLLGTYSPRVTHIAGEIDIVIRAAEIRNHPSEKDVSSKQMVKANKRAKSPKQRLVGLLDSTELTLSEIIDIAEMPSDQLLDLLRDLEAEGVIAVSIKRRG